MWNFYKIEFSAIHFDSIYHGEVILMVKKVIPGSSLDSLSWSIQYHKIVFSKFHLIFRSVLGVHFVTREQGWKNTEHMF